MWGWSESDRSYALVFLSVQLALWLTFLFVGRHTYSAGHSFYRIGLASKTGTTQIIFDAVLISVAFAVAVRILVGTDRPKSLGIAATLNAFVLLVGVFSTFYWGSGACAKKTACNWSTGLSRRDAVLVALGNFTTAGTGGITPASEFARGLVALQLGLDIAVGVVLLGLLISRLTRG